MTINLKVLSGVLIFFSNAVLIAANTNTNSSTNSNRNSVSRCFQFTWLGPRYNNESIFLNATCQHATRLTNGVPCQEPLVASYDGTWPDVEYIWTYHGLNASCILADNDVCAQYTYYFNGRPENSTYMCTRAVDGNGTAINGGCFEEVSGSYSTRACFCRSVPGGVPCNNANRIITNTIIYLSIAMSVIKSIK